MKTFKITINAVHEIEAESEEEAVLAFWDEVVYDTQTDPATFLGDNMSIKEIN